jgi:hypothetical protein
MTDSNASSPFGQASSPSSSPLGHDIPQDPLTFLRLLYGDDAPGWLTISTFDSQPTQWFPAHQLEQVATYCQAIARRYNVYFGLGLRQEQLDEGRGESTDVLGIPGLWVELDIKHPVHKKIDLPETMNEALTLVQEAIPLKPSIIIDSGYGAHIHWLFKELWLFEDTEERQKAYHLLRRLQGTIRAVAKLHGWDIDSTFDLARVLRIAGTYNRNIADHPKLVDIIEAHADRRYNPSDFDEHLIAVDDITYEQTTSEEYAGELPPIDLQALNIPTWLKTLIRFAEDVNAAKPYPSRSEALFDAVQGLIKAGIDDRMSMSLLLDSRYMISEKPREQGRRWLAGELARAHTKLNGHRPTSTSTPEPEASAPTDEEQHSSQIGDNQQPAIELPDVINTFQSWLELSDPAFIEILLGTYVANLIPGDPVWLLGIGPSSGGKTEPLLALTGLPQTYMVSTLTEGSLLSGTPMRDKAKGAKGGLLREIGEFGYLICKDFTSVLSIQDKVRAPILAALREIFDGKWDRSIGTDGGRMISWKGKVAFIGGCTDAIDSHYVLMAAMGQRFFLFRLPTIDAHAQALKAFDGNAKETAMRDELRNTVKRFFQGRHFDHVDPTAVSPAMREHLIQLAMLTVMARSPIERDPRKRDITLIPDPEAPARATKVIGKIWAGLRAIGVSEQRAWHLVRKLGFDSMPKLRHAVLELLALTDEPQKTQTLAMKIAHPTQTTRRALEDLNGHKVVQRQKGKGADLWSLTDSIKASFEKIPKTLPERDFHE